MHSDMSKVAYVPFVRLMMNIDDREMVERMSKGDDSDIATDPILFFGGYNGVVPETLVGSTRPFIGCISDVTVNNKYVFSRQCCTMIDLLLISVHAYLV